MTSRLRWLGVCAVLAASLLVNAKSAAACDCHDGGPVCEAFWKKPVVFVGRVVSVTPVPSEYKGVAARKTRFRVTESLRGPTGPFLDLISYSTSCDLFFGEGEAWIIYAGPRHDGPGLSTSTCSRSRPLSEAREDLEYARSVYASKSEKGRVFGEVRDYTAPEHSTVPGARLTFTSPTWIPVQAITDRDGRYEAMLSPGQYRITADLPAGMAALSGHAVELIDARGCAVADVFVHRPGRIAGRVVTADRAPVPNVTIELIRRDGFDDAAIRIRGMTDAHGRFEISGVTPGAYTPAVAIGHVEAPAVQPVYLFSGNTTSKNNSRRVQIDGGSTASVGDMMLPGRSRVAQISGVVVHPDGRPAPGAKVRMKADFDEPSLPWTSIHADSRGRFVFAMMVGTRYRLVVDGPGPYDSRPQATVVDPASPPSALRLVVR